MIVVKKYARPVKGINTVTDKSTRLGFLVLFLKDAVNDPNVARIELLGDLGEQILFERAECGEWMEVFP